MLYHSLCHSLWILKQKLLYDRERRKFSKEYARFTVCSYNMLWRGVIWNVFREFRSTANKWVYNRNFFVYISSQKSTNVSILSKILACLAFETVSHMSHTVDLLLLVAVLVVRRRVLIIITSSWKLLVYDISICMWYDAYWSKENIWWLLYHRGHKVRAQIVEIRPFNQFVSAHLEKTLNLWSC